MGENSIESMMFVRELILWTTDIPVEQQWNMADFLICIKFSATIDIVQILLACFASSTDLNYF